MMTARERLFAVLQGKPVDMLPVWLLFPYHRTSYYVDVRTNPCYVPIFEKSKQCAIMLNRRNPHSPLFSPEVTSETVETEEDGWRVRRWTLSYCGRTLTSESRRKGDRHISKPLLTSEEDLDVLLTFPINDDRGLITEQLREQGTRYEQEKSEFPLDYGAMMLDLGEPIGFLYGNSDLQEFAMWSLACSDKVVQFLDKAMEHYRLVYQHCLERNWADVYFMVGSELASPPMVSRDTFQKWIVPYARELIDMIHAHGCYVIQHYHGQIKLILEDFLYMGADAVHTVEAPPTGNCTLSEACAVWKDRITIIGNIQYDLFRSLTPDQMRQEVRNVVAEIQANPRSRLILSPTAGPYEEEISPRMIENYLAFLDEASKIRM